MKQANAIVVGVDVGGDAKGFHAVALQGGAIVKHLQETDPAAVASWCLERDALVVAVDAPCEWSKVGSSRRVERELKVSGSQIHCFATPTRKHAQEHKKGFYGWVFNGERLYQQLTNDYPLFNGTHSEGRICFETFPHAIVCAVAGRVISAKPKATVRRAALRRQGYDIGGLSNIDFVDAALCAVAADAFLKGRYQLFGDQEEGFIVVPKS